jgi:hypothetical protein
MATVLQVAARDASYFHRMLRGATATLCGLSAQRMSEGEAAEGYKVECVACHALTAALAGPPALQTPPPAPAGEGQGQEAQPRGAAMTETDPGRGPDRAPRNTQAEETVLAYVLNRPGAEQRRQVIAAATGLGPSTVGSVLDRAIRRRQVKGLWKPRRAVWQYDPPGVHAAQEAPKPVLLDKTWKVLTEEPTKDGRFIAIGEQSGRPYTFDLL